MLFDILGAIASSAVEAVSDQVNDIKDGYNKYYDEYSRRCEDWDDQRLIELFRKISHTGNTAQKMAITKVVHDRGIKAEDINMY